jgi:hypothetical protein
VRHNVCVGECVFDRNVSRAASDNMKRTWVNYGLKRDWFDKAQGQV